MTMTTTIAQWIVRIAGILALILGLLDWAGDLPPSTVGLHMLLGVLTVLGLWLLAATASQQGIPVGTCIGIAVLGLITLVFGLIQRGLLPDSAHWVIQLVHLILGMATVGSGEMIGGRLRRARLAAA